MKKIGFTLLLLIAFFQNQAQIASLDSTGVTINLDSINGCMSIEFQLITSDSLTLKVFNRWGAIDTTFLLNVFLLPEFYSYKFIPKDSTVGTYTYSLTNRSDSEIGNISYLGNQNSLSKHRINTDFSVWPNPAQNVIHFQHRFSGNTTLTLYTASGQKLNEKVIEHTGEMDMSEYGKGMYVLEIKNGSTSVAKKIMKK